MPDISPLWWDAGATSLLAVQNGITMFKDNKQMPATPSPVGITGTEFLTGAVLISAAVIILAAAVLGSAVIVHHGLALSA